MMNNTLTDKNNRREVVIDSKVVNNRLLHQLETQVITDKHKILKNNHQTDKMLKAVNMISIMKTLLNKPAIFIQEINHHHCRIKEIIVILEKIKTKLIWDMELILL